MSNLDLDNQGLLLGLIFNIIVSVWIIPTYIGSKRKIGYFWSMVFCLFLTPLIGLIITLLSPKKNVGIHKPDSIELKTNISQPNPKETLLNLKQSGALTEAEYIEKLEIQLKREKQEIINQEIEQKERSIQLKMNPYIIQMSQLLKAELLTKEEFDFKLNELRARFLVDYENQLVQDIHVKPIENRPKVIIKGTLLEQDFYQIIRIHEVKNIFGTVTHTNYKVRYEDGRIGDFVYVNKSRRYYFESESSQILCASEVQCITELYARL